MDLKEFLITGVEDIVRQKLFVLAAIVLIAIWLPGCGPTLQDKMMEARRETLELAKKAGDKALKCREDFLNCMSDYGLKNARASASATEIAEAAVSQCQYPLEMFRYYQSSYYSSMYSLAANSPYGILVAAQQKGEEKARFDAQDLIEEGKRRVINILVRIRQ